MVGFWWFSGKTSIGWWETRGLYKPIYCIIGDNHQNPWTGKPVLWILLFFCVLNVEARTNEETLMPNQRNCWGIQSFICPFKKDILRYIRWDLDFGSDPIFFSGLLAVCSSAFSSEVAAKEWFHRIYIYNKAPLARWHRHVTKFPVEIVP